MKWKVAAVVVLGLVVFGWCSIHAQAGIYIPNVVNAWEDNDFETLFDRDPAPGVPAKLTPGDWLVGIWQVQKVGNAYTDPASWIADGQFTAVFVLQVLTATTPGGQFGGGTPTQLTMGPTPFVDVGLDGLDDNWQGFGLKRTGAGTMAVLYDDPGPPPEITSSPFLAGLASASDGTMLWEVGFTGDPQEFWIADLNNPAIPPPTALLLDYVASLNVTVPGAGPSVAPHGYFSSLPGAIRPYTWVTQEGVLGAPILSEFQLHGGKGDVLPGAFALSTDTDIFYMPIPEPASLAIWAILASITGVVLARRRRR